MATHERMNEYGAAEDDERLLMLAPQPFDTVGRAAGERRGNDFGH